MKTRERAFIFDMNGTMIDDMGFHLQVWFDLLNKDLEAGMSWDEVKEHMYGKNSELLERIFGKGRFTQEELDYWSIEKEKRYQSVYLPHLKLLNGLEDFLDSCCSVPVPMAIGSAAIPFNIDFVLDNLKIREYFSCIVSAEDVTRSKPDPETFLKAASLLETEPSRCIVFEDAPKGVEAARNASMECVVLLTAHEKEAFGKYDNVIALVKDYSDPFFKSLIEI